MIRVPGWLLYLAALVPLWVVATGRWHPVQIGWGLFVAIITLPLSWRIFSLGRSWPLRDVLYGLLGVVRSFVVLFVPDAVRSSIDMARRVVQPVIPMRPGIVAVPLRFRGPLDAFLLMSHVTLTPGNFIVDVDEERGLLFVHAIDVSDPEAIRRQVQEIHVQELRRLYP
jgi:multicomponent Na+:H+ antiporter subunit E